MAKSIMADKRRIIIDGEEIPGLRSIDEYVLEEDLIDVPEFDKIRKVKTGIKKIPEINAVYNIRRDTITMKFFQDWYNKNQTKEIIEIQTDGSGAEVARYLWSEVELSKIGRPAADSASVADAQVSVTFVPEDIEPQTIRA